eukprot:gb/GEZN01013456.1/.p1 GENE.gb/GEZN01013456.1/~~gb/GEZN01013456.1/.p1  ORF type:complete len:251 (-),score=16.44 gb/GEZN01013456.1/:261-950(-)
MPKARTASDGKCYYSYAQIAEAIHKKVPEVKAFNPDVLIAIGGGGFIPARMLRTEIAVPILAISLKLYSDSDDTRGASVCKKQWFDETPGTFGALVRGHRVLLVDEVDDTRATLAYAVREIQRLHSPAAIAILVVHNKQKNKTADLPADVVYISCLDVQDKWNCYPWDASKYGRTIRQHEELACYCHWEGQPDPLAWASVSLVRWGTILAAGLLVGLLLMRPRQTSRLL